MSEIPASWTLANVGDVADVNPPSSTVTTRDDALVSFLPMAAVEEISGRIDLSCKKPFGAVKKGFTRFREGDVLFAKITPSMENGKIAVARDLEGGIGCGTTEFHVIRPREDVDADYLRYFLVRSAFRQEARRNMQGAVGQQRVPANFLRDSSIPLAPSREQKRIASKVDELFSRIEEGERALERVRQLVERYRQSVLKAAVTGELTREWREDNKDKIESGEALIARILKVRREIWERTELDKMKAKGVKPANDSWKERYEEPIAADPSGLPKLPESWVWVSLDQVSSLITSGSRGWSEHYSERGSIFVRAQNIKHDKLELDDVAYVALNGVTEGARTKVELDDLLVTITGANVTKSARVTVALDDAYVSQHVALVRPVDRTTSSFLYQWIVSPANGRKTLLSAAYGAGKPGLSLQDLKELPVALPSPQEQAVICDRITSEIGRLEKVLEEQRQHDITLSRLRQSVLKSAFCGALVGQDEGDEPAGVLLERIDAQRGRNTARRKSGSQVRTAT